MQDMNIIVNDGIKSGRVEIISVSKSEASSKAEAATTTDDRQLPDRLENGVPAQDCDGAALVFTLSQSEIHSHQQPHLIQCGRSVKPLRPPNHRRRRQVRTHA